MYSKFGIDEKVINLSKTSMEQIRPVFDEISKIVEHNTLKVISAMQEYQLSEMHFHGTTGYGYDDVGRDTIEKIYAKIFGTEDALVRIQFISGTNALTTMLFGLLRPGDTLMPITGKPYDTLSDVINGENIGSLKDFGVNYKEFALDDDGNVKIDEVLNYIKENKVKVIELQRSRGYSFRKSFSVEYLDSIIEKIKQVDKDVIVVVDNCYGEFVEKEEPKADVLVGSLIKNMGGGIAPTGAYIVGRKDLIELIANRHTSPGVGKECGASLGFNKQILQGLFFAPHIVGEALKTAVFAANMMEQMGFIASPKWNEKRADIIQAIKFGNEEKLIKFCQGIQKGSAIDSHVVPYPWDMPGYTDKVIMAAGAFNQGSSIELSADAPIREPYAAYMQGGLTFESGKLGIMSAANMLIDM
ncbi:MAG: methionine gamma-lyase family protein [Clostridia bacterium]|nr:methionine gamma-lyase family protein [Clostridia bacterium]